MNFWSSCSQDNVLIYLGLVTWWCPDLRVICSALGVHLLAMKRGVAGAVPWLRHHRGGSGFAVKHS